MGVTLCSQGLCITVSMQMSIQQIQGPPMSRPSEKTTSKERIEAPVHVKRKLVRVLWEEKIWAQYNVGPSKII